MHLTSLISHGFRNLEGEVPLSNPLTVLVGENNAGKSNVVEALRLLSEPETGPGARRWITERDFRHDGHGRRLTSGFNLEVRFDGLTTTEKARMVTCLAPSLGPNAARLRLNATLSPRDRIEVEWFGGDSHHPDVERWARESLTHTYLHPLRDATGDLRPGRDNRLTNLLAALAPTGHADRTSMEAIVQTANEALADVPSVVAAREGVQERLATMTGQRRFTQKTDLVFAEPRFDRVVSTLRALAGELAPLELGENGLGYNNLLYMAVLMAALTEPNDTTLRLLLVEEPEAHLHPQLQELLMRYLESGSGQVQVVVTTHSPNLASAAMVERMTVMARLGDSLTYLGRAPKDFGLTASQSGHLRRFLDVTKAGLLFARGVILVEGVAEQLLLPAIAQRLGRPLTTSGVAVINVGGLAFEPFLQLFGVDRLPARIAVVSDSDPPAGVISDDADSDEGQPTDQLSAVASRLRDMQGAGVKVCLASKTLEWDLAAAGNWEVLLSALTRLKPRVASKLRRDVSPDDHIRQGDELLNKVRNIKGPFAQELTDLIEDESVSFKPPKYLEDAITWVTE